LKGVEIMRKLMQRHHAPTGNDRGNAVAIVLLVLAVTSLIGVGLLTQSRMDLKFVTSYKSHTTALNLADGAASIALTRVSFTMAPMYEGQATPTLLNKTYYADPQYVKEAGNPTGTALQDRGTYWPLMVFQGPVTDPTKMAGWELGKEGRALECWTAQGSGKRRDTAGMATSNEEIRKGRHMPTETAVQIATNKRPPM
jgi:hypothetical protein